MKNDLTLRKEQMLNESHYCDCSHPEIKIIVESVSSSGDTPSQAAQKLFLFVRDHIVFGMDEVRVKASETLEKGYGACWNKALLLVALLRCRKIPARVGWVPVKRNFSKPAFGMTYLFTNQPFNHGFSEVYLEGKWIKADPTLDKKTFHNCFLPLNLKWGIDWNGEDDHILYKDSIIGNPCYTEDIDRVYENNFGNKIPHRIIAPYISGILNKRLWGRM